MTFAIMLILSAPGGLHPGSLVPIREPSGPLLGGHALTAALLVGPGEPPRSLVNYSVTFGETGLPVGVAWSIGIQFSNNGIGAGVQAPQNITFSLANGTGFQFRAWGSGYTPMPWSGKFNVTGTPLRFMIAFQKTLFFPVWINESGLPTGTNWSAALVGSGEWSRYFLINSSTTRSILFIVPAGFNGTFTASPPSPYRWITGNVATPASGGPVGVTVRFGSGLSLYPVSFREAGLAPGTGWSVDLDGANNVSTTGEIGFLEPNGTGDTFQVGSVPGYSATPASGSFSIVGSPVLTTVTFAAVGGTLGVRGWANLTASGGGDTYCVDGTGEVRTHPAWENVSLAAVAWNGSPPYHFSWSTGDGGSGLSGSRVQHTYTGFGIWTANVTVVDSTGTTASTPLSVRDAPPPMPAPDCQKGLFSDSTFLGLPTLEGYALIGGIAVVTVLSLTWYRRRKSTPRPPGKEAHPRSATGQHPPEPPVPADRD